MENLRHRDKMPSLSFDFSSEMAGNFINLLRASKAEINERLKMFYHYGFFRRISPELKELCRRSINNGNGCDLPGDLSAALERIKELSRIEINTIENPPSITFISYAIPRADRTSSGLRLFNILKILLQRKYKINFLYCSRSWNEKKYVKIFEGDINFGYLPLNMEGYNKFFSR